MAAVSYSTICTVRSLKPQSDKGWTIILILYKNNRVTRWRGDENCKTLNELRTSDKQ